MEREYRMPFQIIRSDITKIKADAIVNTANPEPVCGGGVDSAVYKAAGTKQLLAERKKIGPMKAGQAAITPAFQLDARFIIHTVGPVWKGGWRGEKKVLRACYDNCLGLAFKNHCESIAFPLISTGVYGFPKEKALQIALAAVSEFLMEHEMTVYLAVFDQESFRLSGRLYRKIEEFIDDHYAESRLEEECALRNFSERRQIVDTASMPPLPDSMLKMSEPSEQPGRKYKPAVPHPKDLLRESPAPDPEELPCAAAAPDLGKMPCASAAPQSQILPQASAGAARSLEDVINNVGETFQERLLRFIDERNLTNAQVYKKANLSRKLFSKILCNPDYQPKKRTVIAFAIALQLNLDDTKDLMARAGFALSPGSRFDLVIEYFIEKKVYDIYTINVALFDHDLPMLGE